MYLIYYIPLSITIEFTTSKFYFRIIIGLQYDNYLTNIFVFINNFKMNVNIYILIYFNVYIILYIKIYQFAHILYNNQNNIKKFLYSKVFNLSFRNLESIL